MRSRTGKIARLPRPIREDLNRRLERADPGPVILAWLNARPEVKIILHDEFGGRGVTKQNLSHWRQGGFRDWLARDDLRAGLQDVREFPADWQGGEDLKVIDNAATIMAARLAGLLTRWNGEHTSLFEAKARSLNALCLSIVRLQRQMRRAGGKTAQPNPLHDNGIGNSPKQSNPVQ